MEYVASYPLTEDVLTPHVGRNVVGYTLLGDPFCGKIHACKDGHIHLAPLERPDVVTSGKVNKLKNHQKRAKTQKKATISSVKSAKRVQEKAKISLYGYGYQPYGYQPYGYGYGYGGGFVPGFGFGLGAGIGFALPLLAIGALFFI